MIDLAMIEPACFRKYEYEDGEIVDVEYNGIDSFSCGRKNGDPLYAAPQMEAYAAAWVREALEEAQSLLMAMYTDAVKARVPEAEDKEGWNESCLERALAISDATMKIRALIPK